MDCKKVSKLFYRNIKFDIKTNFDLNNIRNISLFFECLLLYIL